MICLPGLSNCLSGNKNGACVVVTQAPFAFVTLPDSRFDDRLLRRRNRCGTAVADIVDEDQACAAGTRIVPIADADVQRADTVEVDAAPVHCTGSAIPARPRCPRRPDWDWLPPPRCRSCLPMPRRAARWHCRRWSAERRRSRPSAKRR